MKDFDQCGALIPQKTLMTILGLKKTTFFEMKKRPDFPKPIKQNEHRSGAVYYKKPEVVAWYEQLGKAA